MRRSASWPRAPAAALALRRAAHSPRPPWGPLAPRRPGATTSIGSRPAPARPTSPGTSPGPCAVRRRSGSSWDCWRASARSFLWTRGGSTLWATLAVATGRCAWRNSCRGCRRPWCPSRATTPTFRAATTTRRRSRGGCGRSRASGQCTAPATSSAAPTAPTWRGPTGSSARSAGPRWSGCPRCSPWAFTGTATGRSSACSQTPSVSSRSSCRLRARRLWTQSPTSAGDWSCFLPPPRAPERGGPSPPPPASTAGP
mmetsp:Transcript_133786/g.416116  ORF Transcript_133786/g.416116 Transcript_133786/m.416116 type:complete len:256 (-) Transcript_133786:95-862(-)